jgi:serine/threonine protein kinase
MVPAVGDRLAGRYEIRAVTADRPTGLLYRAYDHQIGVEVALRIIDAELLSAPGDRRAFVERTVRAKTLQHPNLIRLYDVVVDHGVVFLVNSAVTAASRSRHCWLIGDTPPKCR